MDSYLLAMIVIFAVLAGWIGVQNLSRRFAARHPEFGPYVEKVSGCGACSGKCNADTEGSQCEK
jgi:threonine/homoserine/homoserine lactone efflux protein